MDTSVLINLCHVGRLSLLGELPLRFVYLDHVKGELLDSDQASMFDEAVAAGWLEPDDLPALQGAALFERFNQRLGRGESACLAYASVRNVHIGCDERKKAFLNAVSSIVPPPRIWTTPNLYLMAVQAGTMTVMQADADKAVLASRRFAMKFASYADLI